MVKQIIKEAMDQNPLGLKEAVAEELRNRISEALEASMNEDYWVLYIDGKKWKSYRTDAFAKADAKEARRSGKEAKIVKVKGDFKESVDLEEAEQIDEISKELAHNYYRKASKDIGSQAASANDFRGGSGDLKGRLNRTYNRDGSRTKDADREKDRDTIARYDAARKTAERKIKNRATGLSRASARMESLDLEEAKMTDAEVLSAAKALAANGKDDKTRAFGKGLVDFYKKEGSFTPAQVGGLQNIMKNASFQMAKDE